MLILVGTLLLAFRKQLLEYSQKIDAEGGQRVKREVREIRIIMVSLFIIMMGIVGLIV